MLTREREIEILESRGHSSFVLRAFADLFEEIETLRKGQTELIKLYENQGRDYDQLIIKYCKLLDIVKGNTP